MVNTLDIKYTFRFQHKELVFNYSFDKETFALIYPPQKHVEPWVKLGFHKCVHCPLDEGTHPNCPIANILHHIIGQLESQTSYEEVSVEVDTPNRKIISKSKTKMQGAIASLLGLLIPSSGCPHTKFFRPMARFHLPFSDGHETVYRVFSMFLLDQYFKKKSKMIDIDFNKLNEAYKNISIVDKHICKRLREVTDKDASLNALNILYTTSSTIRLAKRREFIELQKLFKASSVSQLP